MLRDAGTVLTDEELGDQIASLAAEMSAAMCRWLMLVADFDERGAWGRWGCVSCAHWVSWRCGVAPVTAREHVRIARRLRELPLVNAAFARGVLSYSKVRALARVEGVQQEAELVALARHASAAQLERIVGAFRTVTREQADLRYVSRSLDLFTDDDGCLQIRGRLPPEMGAALLAAVRAAEADLERALPDAAADTPDGPGAGVTAADPTRPTAQARRADALVWLAQRAVGNAAGSGTAGPGAAITARAAEVVVHVDARLLADDAGKPDDARTPGAGEAPGGAMAPGHLRTALEDGPALAVETARRLCCDAGIVPVLTGPDGEVLDVGRRTRSIPSAIGRALRVRDAGCRFPGCDRTRWLQAHHVEHWARGGATRLSNLVLLCHHHHQVVHEGGFSLSATGDGDGFAFRTPQGHLLAQVPAAPRVEAVAARAVGAQAARGGPEDAAEGPGAMSLYPLSAGAPWDLGYAVDALLEWTAPTILEGCP